MTTKAEYEELLQGRDSVTNAIINHLVLCGWEGDRIIKNVAQKRYAPNMATIRVKLDSCNRLYSLEGEYISEGQNVLSIYGCYVKADTPKTEIISAVAEYLRGIEVAISNSYAVRLLANA